MTPPDSPEVEAGVERLVALLLVQPPERVPGEAVQHQPVQVAVPLDLDADHAPLWLPGGSARKKKKRMKCKGK